MMDLINKFSLKKAKTTGFYRRKLVFYLWTIDYRGEYHYLNKKW